MPQLEPERCMCTAQASAPGLPGRLPPRFKSRPSTDIRMPRRLDALRVPRLRLLRARAASAAWAGCMRAAGPGGAPLARALARNG